MTANLFRKARQKDMERLFDAPVVKVEEIEIWAISPNQNIRIVVDAHVLDADEAERLARADGFQSWEEMSHYWRQLHGTERFFGQIIHWDFKRRLVPALLQTAR